VRGSVCCEQLYNSTVSHSKRKWPASLSLPSRSHHILSGEQTNYGTHSTFLDVVSEAMSETSTIRADSPVCQQSEDDDVNLRKPLLIDVEYEVETPNQYLPTYAAQLSQLQRRLSQNDRNLGDSAVVSSSQIIIFDDHPSYLVPRAKIADPELDRKLAAWHWSTSPDAASPSVGHIFLAHQLLTLVTNFTRDAGNDTKTDIAKTLLQARCIEALEEFTTPTTYRSRQVESRHYYGICLALHQHRNHLVRDARGGSIGRVLGRLSSWVPHQDMVTLYIQSLCGGSSSLHLSWQDACGPDSKAISFPPLLNREARASQSPLPNCTTMKTKVTGGSAAIVRLLT
jgi:hypothetical protein